LSVWFAAKSSQEVGRFCAGGWRPLEQDSSPKVRVPGRPCSAKKGRGRSPGRLSEFLAVGEDNCLMAAAFSAARERTPRSGETK
jgi:hypothetical protein